MVANSIEGSGEFMSLEPTDVGRAELTGSATVYEPQGLKFFDYDHNQHRMLVTEGGWASWLAYKHPDGQWVSLRPAIKEDYLRVCRKSVLLTDLAECYEILQKTMRRCVRDMRHMLDQIPAGSGPITQADWRDRLSHYELVLGGTADYRLSVHREVAVLEGKIRQLEASLQHEINKNTGHAEPSAEKQQSLFDGEPF